MELAWTVERQSDGKAVGHVGFLTSSASCSLPFADEPEMGWMLTADTHRQGYGRSCRAAVDWFGRTFDSVPIPAIISSATNCQ